MCNNDSPFYLTINPNFTSSGVWYRVWQNLSHAMTYLDTGLACIGRSGKQQPMGFNKLAAIMKECTKDVSWNIIPSWISGLWSDVIHRPPQYVSSLNAYEKPCQQKQRKMSESLCDLYSGTCGPASKQAKQPSGDISQTYGAKVITVLSIILVPVRWCISSKSAANTV